MSELVKSKTNLDCEKESLRLLQRTLYTIRNAARQGLNQEGMVAVAELADAAHNLPMHLSSIDGHDGAKQLAEKLDQFIKNDCAYRVGSFRFEGGLPK